MAKTPRAGDLQIEHDVAFQRREWMFQRIGWTIMLLVVLAALAGLLGRGPLSQVTVSTPDGSLRLTYNRFVHYHDPTTLEIEIAGGVADGRELRVWLDDAYLAGIEIQSITPAPDHFEAGSDRHTLVFRVSDPRQATRITIHFQADQMLALSGRAGIGDQVPVSFDQFVYP
jgi:hypothetical protein